MVAPGRTVRARDDLRPDGGGVDDAADDRRHEEREGKPRAIEGHADADEPSDRHDDLALPDLATTPRLGDDRHGREADRRNRDRRQEPRHLVEAESGHGRQHADPDEAGDDEKEGRPIDDPEGAIGASSDPGPGQADPVGPDDEPDAAREAPVGDRLEVEGDAGLRR